MERPAPQHPDGRRPHGGGAVSGGVLGPEASLIVSCARVSCPPQVERRVRALASGPLDWPAVLRSAAFHYVVPLLFRNLSAICPDAVPAPVLAELEERAGMHAQRNRERVPVLAGLLELLTSQGVSAIPFKGITLAHQVYGGLDLRQTADVDLLVARDQFLQAEDALVRAGFRHVYFGHHEVATLQAQLLRDEPRLCVDLHYGITPQFHQMNVDEIRTGSTPFRGRRNRLDTRSTFWFFHLDGDALSRDERDVVIDGTPFPALTPEDTVLVALVQGVKENWRTLRRVCDMAELVRAFPDLDWAGLRRRARDIGCERMLLLGLHLAWTLLDAPLPEPLRRELGRAPVVGSLAREIGRRMFDDVSPPEWKILHHATCMLTVDSGADRMRYLRYLLRWFASRPPPPAAGAGALDLCRCLARVLAGGRGGRLRGDLHPV